MSVEKHQWNLRQKMKIWSKPQSHVSFISSVSWHQVSRWTLEVFRRSCEVKMRLIFGLIHLFLEPWVWNSLLYTDRPVFAHTLSYTTWCPLKVLWLAGGSADVLLCRQWAVLHACASLGVPLGGLGVRTGVPGLCLRLNVWWTWRASGGLAGAWDRAEAAGMRVCAVRTACWRVRLWFSSCLDLSFCCCSCWMANWSW